MFFYCGIQVFGFQIKCFILWIDWYGKTSFLFHYISSPLPLMQPHPYPYPLPDSPSPISLLLLYASLLFTYLFCRNYSKLTKGTGGGSGAGKTKLDKERQKWLAKEMVSRFWYLIILTHCSMQSKWSLYCNICKVPIFFYPRIIPVYNLLCIKYKMISQGADYHHLVC